MPNQRGDKRNVTITLREDLLDWVDTQRQRYDQDRSTFIRACVYRVAESGGLYSPEHDAQPAAPPPAQAGAGPGRAEGPKPAAQRPKRKATR